MKKLSLKQLKLDATEMLERNQLKTILGGYGGDGSYGSNSCWVTCNSSNPGEEGSTYNIPNCDGAPDGACHSTGWTWCSCW
ncbi:hypothetical protein [Polaribacter reichenbachii]|nr:hypothetical protein [Polaribacter reichenbachii]